MGFVLDTTKNQVMSLHLPPNMSKRLNLALAKAKTQNPRFTKQELLRQMILYCLNDIRFTPKGKDEVNYNEEF